MKHDWTKKRAEDATEISSLLREIRRAVYPLQNVEIGYEVSFPGSAPELAAYKKRVLQFVAEVSASHAKLKANHTEGDNVATVAPGVEFMFAGWHIPDDITSPRSPKIESIEVTSGSLYPDAKREASFAPALTDCAGLIMSFNRAQEREAKQRSRDREDLEVWAISGKAELMFSPSEDVFVKSCDSIHTKMHHPNGSITSIEDLANASVVIFQSFDITDHEGPDFDRLQKMMARGKLQFLYLTIAGRAVIHTSNLQVLQISGSDPFSASTPESVYHFPADVAEGSEPEP